MGNMRKRQECEWMSADKVSIIIPVYNAEKYLKKCLDSVLNQSYQCFEVIAVNDGSGDSSWEILQKYANKHPDKFKIFTQENQGQSVARNNALENATGVYVAFLDSDDYIEPDYLERLVAIAQENESDMVGSGEVRVDEEGNTVSVIRYKVDKKGRCLLRRLNFSGKIYRRDFLEKHNMKFAVGKVYEDNPFNIQAYSLAKNLKIIDYIGYWQMVHMGSTTTKKVDTGKLPFREIEEMMQYIERHKDEVADYDLYEYTILSFFTYFIFKANKQHYYFDIDGRKSNEDVVCEICDYVERVVKKYLTGIRSNRYLKSARNYGVSVSQSIGVRLCVKLIQSGNMKKFVKWYFRY